MTFRWLNQDTEIVPLGQHNNLDPSTVALALFKASPQTVYLKHFSGLLSDVSLEKLHDAFYDMEYYAGIIYDESNTQFLSDNGMISLSLAGKKNGSISGVNSSGSKRAEPEYTLSWATQSLQHHEVLKKLGNEFFSKKNAGHVYAATVTFSGLEPRRLGSISHELVRANYTQEMLDDLDKIIENINNPEPFGRLTILTGQPGSGKTHMIEEIIRRTEDSVALMLSPEQVSALSGPAYISLLTRDYESSRFLLVIEDGGTLIQSKGEKATEMQAMLNYSDGILGKMLNVQIVVTSNTDYIDVDPAIQRGGRLFKHVHYQGIPFGLAVQRYNELTDTQDGEVSLKHLEGQTVTLSELYGCVKQHVVDAPKKKKPAGFSL